MRADGAELQFQETSQTEGNSVFGGALDSLDASAKDLLRSERAGTKILAARFSF